MDDWRGSLYGLSRTALLLALVLDGERPGEQLRLPAARLVVQVARGRALVGVPEPRLHVHHGRLPDGERAERVPQVVEAKLPHPRLADGLHEPPAQRRAVE